MSTARELDQQKRGLQDDHDPSDIGQRQANKTGGIKSETSDEAEPRPGDGLPEGLRGERKGPLDNRTRRDQKATQVPKNEWP